jgi:hypothetical protein
MALRLLEKRLHMEPNQQAQRLVRELSLSGQKWELVAGALLPLMERQVPQCQRREVPLRKLHR